jgi:GTP-binding protein
VAGGNFVPPGVLPHPRNADPNVQKHSIVTETPSPARAESGTPAKAAPHPLQHAEFVQSVANESQLPPPGAPEIAFAGRSNAGKSSAINALANRARLAFTSKMPGRTQQINFFRLRSGALLADLPGYGYAAVPRQLKEHWQRFLARYLETRQSLAGLVLVVDARHGLSDLDYALLEGYVTSGRPVLLLATKVDKLASSAQREAVRAIQRDLKAAFPYAIAHVTVVPFSATRRIGIEAAEATLAQWLPESASVSQDPDFVRTKEEAPRPRGMARGPKYPR